MHARGCALPIALRLPILLGLAVALDNSFLLPVVGVYDLIESQQDEWPEARRGDVRPETSGGGGGGVTWRSRAEGRCHRRSRISPASESRAQGPTASHLKVMNVVNHELGGPALGFRHRGQQTCERAGCGYLPHLATSSFSTFGLQ